MFISSLLVMAALMFGTAWLRLRYAVCAADELHYCKSFYKVQALFVKRIVALLFFVWYADFMIWTNIISDLLQRGYTYAAIGAEIGTTGAAVQMMMRNDNHQPRWITGDKLIALHKRAMRKFPHVDTAA